MMLIIRAWRAYHLGLNPVGLNMWPLWGHKPQGGWNPPSEKNEMYQKTCKNSSRLQLLYENYNFKIILIFSVFTLLFNNLRKFETCRVGLRVSTSNKIKLLRKVAWYGKKCSECLFGGTTRFSPNKVFPNTFFELGIFPWFLNF